MQAQLLAIDLDGTLLDAEHRVPERNRAALHRAHDSGIKIVLCTGRAFTETRGIIEQIGLDLDATVTVFGALVTEVSNGQTLHRTEMTPELAADVCTWFRARGYPVLWLNDPNQCGHDGYAIDGPNRHPAVDAWLARTSCVVHQVPEMPTDAPPPLRLSIIDEEHKLDEVSMHLARDFDGRLTHNVLHAPPYRLSLIESFAHGVSKWRGIERLCERWGVDPQRTVAIGDDVNDIDMIRHAGLGVAVANAKPAVHDVADRTVASNNDCGVADLIDALLSDQ